MSTGLRDRSRLVRDRVLPGSARARDRVRLLRDRLRGRRQLALHERQRDVVGVPLAAHQHLAADDGLRDVPDAGRLSGLSEPLADRALLRRLRRPLRLSRPDPLSHRGDRGRAGGRAAGGCSGASSTAGRRAARLSRRSWSPTATTGTRAGPSPRSGPGASSRASSCTSTTTRRRTRSRASGCSCSGSATRRPTSRWRASRDADKTFLAMRRGAWIVPKYLAGKPTDELGNALAHRAAGGVCPLARTGADLSGRSASRPTTGCRARSQARPGAPDRLLRPAAAARPRRDRR